MKLTIAAYLRQFLRGDAAVGPDSICGQTKREGRIEDSQCGQLKRNLIKKKAEKNWNSGGKNKNGGENSQPLPSAGELAATGP